MPIYVFYEWNHYVRMDVFFKCMVFNVHLLNEKIYLYYSERLRLIKQWMSDIIINDSIKSW